MPLFEELDEDPRKLPNRIHIQDIKSLMLDESLGIYRSPKNEHGKKCRGRQMFTSLMKLAVEANGVIALRMIKLTHGGRSARREAQLMVSEKIHAAFKAGASLMAGASGDEIVHQYRQHVARNAKRLGRFNSVEAESNTTPTEVAQLVTSL